MGGMGAHPPAGGMGGTGPAITGGPMAGAAAQGTALVHTALEALQKALPQLPMGTPMHAAVLKAVTDISKHMDKGGTEGGDKSAIIQQLMELARNAKTNPNAAAAMPQGTPPQAPPMLGAPPMPSPMGE